MTGIVEVNVGRIMLRIKTQFSESWLSFTSLVFSHFQIIFLITTTRDYSTTFKKMGLLLYVLSLIGILFSSKLFISMCWLHISIAFSKTQVTYLHKFKFLFCKMKNITNNVICVKHGNQIEHIIVRDVKNVCLKWIITVILSIIALVSGIWKVTSYFY